MALTQQEKTDFIASVVSTRASLNILQRTQCYNGLIGAFNGDCSLIEQARNLSERCSEQDKIDLTTEINTVFGDEINP